MNPTTERIREITARLAEIEARKLELRPELEMSDITEERMAEIETEANALGAEERTLRAEDKELRRKLDVSNILAPVAAPGSGEALTGREQRIKALRDTGCMSLPLFAGAEQRSVLVSSGKLATPAAVYNEIGELPSTVSSIVDDVDAFDATGTGSWSFPYKKTDAAAAAATEGAARGGTGATFDVVANVGPEDWAVLDEVSNKVKQMTDVAYQAAVQKSAYTALKVTARDKITAKILASTLAEKRVSVALDEKYLRNLVLHYGADDSVVGGAKLYINRADLVTLGDVRGTNEKAPLYRIIFDADGNTGRIEEGGMSVPFSINSALTTGVQLYGNPKTVKMPMWGDYAVTTDDGGDYFKRSMLGIKAEASANAALTVWHGMQIIKQAAS